MLDAATYIKEYFQPDRQPRCPLHTSALNNQDGAATKPEARISPSARRSIWVGLAGGVALIFLALLPPGIYSVDGNGMLAVAESLVSRHSLDVPAELGLPGRSGLFFGKWYPLQSLLAVPFVAAGSAVAHAMHLPAHYVAAIVSLILPALFTGATTALVALVALQLGGSIRAAALAGLSYAFSTIAMVYARTFYAEPLLALLTAGSVYLAIRCSGNDIAWASLLCGLAVLAKPTGIVVGPCICAYLFARKRGLLVSAAPAIGSLAGLVVYMAYNYFRFGHALTFGQPWAFSLSFVPTGIAGLLVSPGRGLIWYSPVLLLAIAGFRTAKKTHALEALLVASLFAGFLSLHSVWSFWGGGWSWGPRFLLPAMPGLAALIGALDGRWRRTAIALAILGFIINAPTLFAFYERYYAEANERGVSEQQITWSLAQAPFLHAWPTAMSQVRDAREQDVRELFQQRGSSPASTVGSSRALRIVALWWWVLPVAGIPRVVGAFLTCVMIGMGVVVISKAYPRSSVP